MEYEEYDYKLSKNNPVLTAKTISDITVLIKTKLNEQNTNSNQNCVEFSEFKYLKNKCLSGDSSISCGAADGVIQLVKWNLIEVSKMMSEVTAMIPFAQNHKGLLIILFDLLIMDMEKKLQDNGFYKCPFNLALPQHPIISTLAHNGSVWNVILSCIKKVNDVENERYKSSLNELFRPVYLYILCDPHTNTTELCRMNFLKFLMEDEFNILVIQDVVVWLQISSIENQIYATNVLITLYESNWIKNNEEFHDFILFWLLSLLLEVCTTKSDPCDIIFVLNRFELRNHKDVELILVFLAKCIEVIQHFYLKDLLKLCHKILPDQLNNLTINILKASLLNWLLYSSDILHNSQMLLNLLLNKLKNVNEAIDFDSNLDQNPYLNSFLNTNQLLHLIFHVFKYLKNPKNTLKFLETSNDFSPFLLKHSSIFIKAIFLDETKIHGDETTEKSLSLLLKDVFNHTNTSNNMLTFLLYKLANTKNTHVHFCVLKSMVQLGKFRENVHVIIATLKALSNTSPKMKTFVLSLFFELWKNELKCYFLVQSMLVDENKLDQRNFSITKAHVIRELCKLKAELYGSELAVYISKILNSCKNDDGIATSFVLEGLGHLCTKGIIDITTAWNTLEPSFRLETRSNVIVSFCKLLSEIENLYIESKKFDKIICDVINKLWDYVLNQTDVKVVEAAYEALATFQFEVVSQQFLEVYQGRLINEDYWFLSILNDYSYIDIEKTITFLTNCLKKEILEYGRGIYYILESKAEPNNYEYLPAKSILRGLMAHMKRNLTSRTKMELACLKIFSQEYPKPLPPLDWCFLQEFVHDVNFRESCINIAAHQAILSGTARRFLENLIVAITQNPKEEDFRAILINVKHFCNSIQPAIIKPFFESSLNYGLNVFENDKGEFFEFIINKITELMEKDDFQDVNKNVIIKIIITKTEEIDFETKEFEKLIQCLPFFPPSTIKSFISPKLWTDFSSKILKRSLNICEILMKKSNESPMVYYNEIINALGDEQIDLEYFLDNISKITHILKDHYTLPIWFLELLGQTQLELIDSNHFSKRISFMCDVLIVTLVTISQQNIFLENFNNYKSSSYMENRIKLLPQSFVVILKEERWNKYITQILEWLYYMVNYETTPFLYRKGFYQSLIALRHEPEFKSTLKWFKYIGCRCLNE